RERARRVTTGAEKDQAGPAIGLVGEQAAHGLPAWNAIVVTARDGDTRAGIHAGDALPVGLAIEHAWVSDLDGERLAFDGVGNQLGLHVVAVARAIQLAVAVPAHHAIVMPRIFVAHKQQTTERRAQAEVDRQPAVGPVLRDLERFAHVAMAAPLTEELAGENVPVAIQMRAPIGLGLVLETQSIRRVSALTGWVVVAVGQMETTLE